MRPTGHNFTAAEIARACGGRITAGPADARASGVGTDTRTLDAGQAFFALVGPNHDAHDFLPQAVAAGAAVLAVERVPGGWRPPKDAAVLRVADTTQALLDLASWHRRRLTARVVAVTGSCGKTTVKDMIWTILAARRRCTRAPSSFNNRIGVALTLLSARCDDDFLVIEMGTNHPGEIDELARAARPHVGVITTIAPVHLEGLDSLQGVREAKAELIPHIARGGALVVNGGNAACVSLLDRFPGACYTFGLDEGVSVRAGALRQTSGGWAFKALGYAFRLHVGGRYNVLNAAAAICAVRALHVPMQWAVEALARFQLPSLRYERRELGGVTLVMDCYNSNPCAMRAAAESFSGEFAGSRKIVVCGDMLELGPEAERRHYELGRDLAGIGLDGLIAVGVLGRRVADGWNEAASAGAPALHCRTAEDAWRPLWQIARPGDAVLVKGSRAMRLETIAEWVAAHLAGRKEKVA